MLALDRPLPAAALPSALVPLPDELATVLAQVRCWSSAPAASPAGPAGAAGGPAGAQQRIAWVRGLRQLLDAAEAAFACALDAVDAHDDVHVVDGARSTQSWLRGALRLAPGDASERVRIARSGRQLLAEPLRALAEGTLVYDQVRAISRDVAVLPPDARPRAVDLLTDLARVADTAAVRVAGRRLRYVVDPDGARAEAQIQFERRYLSLSPLLDGMTAVDGLLDAESATVLSTALAPFLVPAGRADVRTTAQRRADGLVELAHLALAEGTLPLASGVSAEVQVLVRAESLAGVVGSAPALPGLLPDAPGGPGLLPVDAVGRLSCGARLTRLVLDAESVPLDLGRSRRLFSPAQRRALAVRDAGCRFPGCGRPARYTDAHHVEEWEDGGPTDLRNGCLLCRFHHRLVHEGGWRCTVADPRCGTDGRVWFLGPWGQRLSSDPRGP